MASRLHTPLCDLLGIEHPIIQAGMAIHGSGAVPPSPVALVAVLSAGIALFVELPDYFHLPTLMRSMQDFLAR